ncbi:MAG: alpha-ketoglutarate-dependent dioxygenase AlkB family protein [Notoacmeibacter sp.]
MAAQTALVEAMRDVVRTAPLFVPIMPKTGTPMSVRMTNCGSLGWVTDKAKGYRYQSTHPVTGEHWPQMPDVLLKLWHDIANFPAPPEACLVNFYDETAKMGLHQDRDEQDFAAPVVSVSLGDDARFKIGGTSRGGKTTGLTLRSGDILVMGGASRLAYHGIDRIYSGTSTLLPKGGRINLTLRRVNAA